MGALDGQVAIITGATSGIGAATAELFVSEGARVVAVARRPEPGKLLVERLGPDRCIFVQGSVTEPGTSEEAVARAQEEGGLSILVNNAGIDHTSPLLEADVATVQHVMDVNFFGPLQMLQEAGRAMAASDGGSIVNVSSRLGSIGVATMGCYGATKGALESLTRHAAVELAQLGIRVNAVAPGFVRTALYEEWVAESEDAEARRAQASSGIPQGRIAEPNEVAAAIAFLAGPGSSHINGATLPVDGGYTAA